MGVSNSLLSQLPSGYPANENFIGLENFGNTCYLNSVTQALYYCKPLREKLLAYYDANKIDVDSPDSLLDALAAVFHSMSKSTDRLGVLSPKAYVKRLKIDNELFRGYEHQDAQEFLNFLLNSSSEQLSKLNKANGLPASTSFIQDIFEGTLVNETKCICCETVTTRKETFLDLSLDIQSDCTIRDCLRSFSSREMLNKGDKYFCDRCQVRQEAFKCLRIQKLPPVLVLQLKRFKYMESVQRLVKLSFEVKFPVELKIPESDYHAEKSYELFAVVVHIGNSMRQGHYVAMTKANDTWFMYDDDQISVVPFSAVEKCFGNVNAAQHYDSYLLFYQ